MHNLCLTKNEAKHTEKKFFFILKMTAGQELLQELRLEAAVTRRYLENVPFNKLDYKPAEKSETLGRLAIHVAEIIAWWTSVVETDGLDFADFAPKDIQSNEELLSYFDTLLADAIKSLSTVKDEVFEKNWSMSNGEEVYFTLPKKQVARLFCMNHLVHHRAQLGVYLRMLDVVVPATYGPSADDFEVILTHPY
jgi:uncharacterized damage-inducible protein DinB